MITLDTSGLVALLNPRDAQHRAALAVVKEAAGFLVLPLGALCESTYLLERQLGAHATVALLRDIEQGAFSVDCGENDIARIRQLVTRYADLRLGFADAAIIACAERRGGRVLTFDLRHFGVVARGGTITLVP